MKTIDKYVKFMSQYKDYVVLVKSGNFYYSFDEDAFILKYFFETLGPLILESRISRNYNLFYKIVGAENIKHLSSLMIDLYNQNDINKYIELVNLINEIMEYLESLEVEDIEKSLASLENKGIKLNRLKKEEG